MIFAGTQTDVNYLFSGKMRLFLILFSPNQPSVGSVCVGESNAQYIGATDQHRFVLTLTVSVLQRICKKAFAAENFLEPIGLCGTNTQPGISLFKRETDIFLIRINGVVAASLLCSI